MGGHTFDHHHAKGHPTAETTDHTRARQEALKLFRRVAVVAEEIRTPTGI
ncbi:hypothetical protein AB4039_04540 [Streptomyces sp. M-16]